MNETTVYAFPDTENPIVIGVISVWHEDNLYKSEVYVVSQLEKGIERTTMNRTSSLRDTYFDIYSYRQEEVPQDEAYKIQFSGAFGRMNSLISSHLYDQGADFKWSDPVEWGSIEKIKALDISSLISSIKNNTKNKSLKASI